jgi:hypothetical protein
MPPSRPSRLPRGRTRLVCSALLGLPGPAEDLNEQRTVRIVNARDIVYVLREDPNLAQDLEPGQLQRARTRPTAGGGGLLGVSCTSSGACTSVGRTNLAERYR